MSSEIDYTNKTKVTRDDKAQLESSGVNRLSVDCKL